MTYQTDDLRIREMKELISPDQLIGDFPITDAAAAKNGLLSEPRFFNSHSPAASQAAPASPAPPCTSASLQSSA